MREKIANIYFIFLFFVLNLICIDFSVLGINLRTLLLFAVTFIVLVFLLFHGRTLFQWKKITRVDWGVCALMLITLFRLIYQIIKDSTDINQEITALVIGMIYFILRQCQVSLRILLGTFGISNFIVYLMLLIPRFTDGWGAASTEFMTTCGGTLAWLVLGICVNILAYCTTNSKKQHIFYGIAAFPGVLLLFLEKNMTAILLIEVLFVMLPFVFKPTKAFIRRVMMLFLLYNFLLCNMSLLTGYVSVFKGSVTYDLEVSVYLELVLAVIALGFFELWDKCTKGKEEQDIVLSQMLPFFRVLGAAGAIFIGALFTAATRGSSVVLPEVMYKLLSLFILSVAGQNGIFHAIGVRYGVIGAVLVMVFLCKVAVCCISDRGEAPKKQHILKCIAAIYVVQSIFLKQTILTTPLYMVFVIMYWKQMNLKERKITDEVNHSDTMLQ